MLKVALITSGGDGSGINSTIGALARDKKIELYGFHNSFDGIMNGEPIHLTPQYCEHHILDGKQLVRTARSSLAFESADRMEVHEKLQAYGFEYLIICGGNGSQQAAKLMSAEGTKTLFIPMTIDNDIYGSEYAIGYDSALNKILDVIRDIHDTSYNMPGRIFMVEVLGGEHGALALASAIASGSDLAIIPEYCTDKNRIAEAIDKKIKKNKSIVIICSESAYEEKNYKVGEQGVSFDISSSIEEKVKIRVRKTIVGFSMRSGSATFKDTIIAAQMGELARKCIHHGETGVMIGVSDGQVRAIKIDGLNLSQSKELDPSLVNIAIENKIIIK